MQKIIRVQVAGIFILGLALLGACSRYKPNVTMAQAVESGNEKAVAYYLKHGEMVNQKNKDGVPLLMVAVQRGHLNIFEKLLQAGALAQTKDKKKRTALCLAVKLQSAEIVTKLLAAGADVNSTCFVDYEDVLPGFSSRLLKKIYPVNTAMEQDILKYLFEESLNQTEQYPSNALLIAAQQGDRQLVELLLDRGARVNAKGYRGITPLAAAVAGGYAETVQTLLAKGAHVNSKDEEGITALMMASAQGETEIVRLLLEAGAAVNEKDHNAMTALIYASIFGQANVAQQLLEADADPRLVDNLGHSAHKYVDALGYTHMVNLFPEVEEEMFAAEVLTAIKSVAMAEQIYFLQKGEYAGSLYWLDIHVPGLVTFDKFRTEGYEVTVSYESWRKQLTMLAIRKDGPYKGNVFSYTCSPKNSCTGPHAVKTQEKFWQIIQKAQHQ